MQYYTDPLAETKPTRTRPEPQPFEPIPLQPKRKLPGPGWWLLIGLVVFVGYLIFPSHKIVLVLGIDRAAENTAIGRSDTNLLMSFRPLPGEVHGLSVPRDLWVSIPYYGENRINAAHYFGEGEEVGGGPSLAVQTFEQNFEIKIDYYLRIQLEEFPKLIDALGGIDIVLDRDLGGYSTGTHHLDGEQALAFVRNRSGADDFMRMKEGQVFIRALLRAFANPLKWFRLPAVFVAAAQIVDTDIPAWQMPRLAVTALRAGAEGLRFEAVTREMVTPWVTDAGAQVLLPNWAIIKPWAAAVLEQ